jgi:spore coat assembly protein
MIKKGHNFNDIYNYRNSRFFVETVIKARMWEQGMNKMAIFAGACQSYYEALIEAGANFASSPERILIDFKDPLIVAKKIATTEKSRFITINDIKGELRDGEAGISGIGSFGKKQVK